MVWSIRSQEWRRARNHVEYSAPYLVGDRTWHLLFPHWPKTQMADLDNVQSPVFPSNLPSTNIVVIANKAKRGRDCATLRTHWSQVTLYREGKWASSKKFPIDAQTARRYTLYSHAVEIKYNWRSRNWQVNSDHDKVSKKNQCMHKRRLQRSRIIAEVDPIPKQLLVQIFPKPSNHVLIRQCDKTGNGTVSRSHKQLWGWQRKNLFGYGKLKDLHIQPLWDIRPQSPNHPKRPHNPTYDRLTREKKWSEFSVLTDHWTNPCAQAISVYFRE